MIIEAVYWRMGGEKGSSLIMADGLKYMCEVYRERREFLVVVTGECLNVLTDFTLNAIYSRIRKSAL